MEEGNRRGEAPVLRINFSNDGISTMGNEEKKNE